MMLEMPPVLDTDRLHMRKPEPSDARAVFAYAGDVRATRYMTWLTAEDIEDTRDFLADVTAGWAEGDDFCYAVTDRSTGSVIGAASCQFNPHGAEIGYIMSPPFWGQGYATEAAAAIVEAAWTNEDLYRVWATCHVDNLASVRVLEKLGMHCEGRLARWASCPNLHGDFVPYDAYCYAIVR